MTGAPLWPIPAFAGPGIIAIVVGIWIERSDARAGFVVQSIGGALILASVLASWLLGRRERP